MNAQKHGASLVLSSRDIIPVVLLEISVMGLAISLDVCTGVKEARGRKGGLWSREEADAQQGTTSSRSRKEIERA